MSRISPGLLSPSSLNSSGRWELSAELVLDEPTRDHQAVVVGKLLHLAPGARGVLGVS